MNKDKIMLDEKDVYTLLHTLAKKNGAIRAIDFLLKKNVDVMRLELENSTNYYDKDVCNFVFKKKEEAIVGAVIDCDFEKVKYLLENGANVNAKDERDLTLIMLCVDLCNGDATDEEVAKREQILRYLVENGANLEIKNKLYGETALLLALACNRMKQAKVLVELGADVNAKSDFATYDNDYDCLRYVLRYYDVEMIKFLVKNGAEVNDAFVSALEKYLQTEKPCVCYLFGYARISEQEALERCKQIYDYLFANKF